ncbi:hypothetical protein ACIGXM_24345 [Kitasatospora sp. NPDC052896]|uniref:hypothetical protein n=1 Tax=Kitasatospora sp. NPDC052896 TaxID=3364061 RepID=UPI0037C6998E
MTGEIEITETGTVFGPVVVELTGVTQPATFDRVSDALAALWASMRALPLDRTTYLAYEHFLTRPDAEERAIEFAAQPGGLVLSFGLGDGTHLLKLRPARPVATS